MIEASNYNFDCRQSLQRSDSFSTVSSSVAVADILNQYETLKRDIEKPKLSLAASNPSNMKFENSENIQIVYNNYYNQSSAETRVGEKSSTDSISDFQSSPRSSIASSIFSQNFNKLVPPVKSQKFSRKKKIVLAVIVTFVVLLPIISVVTFFYVKKGLNSGNDSENFTSTTEAVTTTEPSTATEPTTTTEPTTSEPTTSEPTTTEPTTKDPEPTYPEYFVSRNGWNADPPKSENIDKLELPIRRIIIAQTGNTFCTNQEDCIAAVKAIQLENQHLDDIPYNFLIGGDERVYEGRGFEYVGQHTQNLYATEYNSIGICIVFIGNYKSTPPSSHQLSILEDFIKFLSSIKAISSNYSIFSQDDLMHNEETANELNLAIAKLSNFHVLYPVYKREEWNAASPKDVNIFNRTMNWTMIGHILKSCTDFTTCSALIKSTQESELKTYDDIRYNFMVAGNGLIFEGRGWDNIGQQAALFELSTISMMVFGDYRYNLPPNNVGISMLQLFEDGLALGKLTDDYKINCRSDFGGPGPGDFLLREIKKWDRYGNKTLT